jgi:hypothetical protein
MFIIVKTDTNLNMLPISRYKRHFIDFDNNLHHNLLRPVENKDYVSNVDSRNYYLFGVFFMVFVMGLLIYVNLYHEYCFTHAVAKLMELRCCFCLKFCLIIKKNDKTNDESIDQIKIVDNQNMNQCENITNDEITLKNAQCNNKKVIEIS